MTADRLLAASVALLCVLALGVTATTLSSSLTSGPGDVVGPHSDGLPFDQHDVSAIRAAVHANDEGDRSASTATAKDGRASRRPSDGGRSVRKPSAGASGSAGASNDGRRPAQSTGGRSLAQRGLLDRLLALLASLWPLLALLLVAALAYRYRDRLRALVAALFGGVARGSGLGRSDADPWAGLDPENEVASAWVTMVRAVGVERPWTKTPGECERAAVDAGMDREAVEAITDAFEVVRYGDEPVTERHVRRARRGLKRLDVGRPVP